MKMFQIQSVLWIALLIIGVSAAEAADYSFRVVGQQGSVSIKRTSGKTEKSKVGSRILNGDIVTLGESSSLNLCHSSGKTARITLSGSYSVQQIEKSLADGKTSVSQKLAKSVMDDMGKGDNMMQTSGLKGKTGLTGAGQRSAAGITPLTAYKSRQFADDISFKWSRYANESAYRFTITNVYDEVVFSSAVKDTLFVTNNRELKLKPEDYYFWYVSPQSDTTIKSKSIGFVVLSQQKISAIQESENQIKIEFPDDVIFQKIILSKLYEQNELIDPALRMLSDAMKADPTDEDVLAAYQSFIVRNKIPE